MRIDDGITYSNTHRCKGSLKAETPIRYAKGTFFYQEQVFKWRLYYVYPDFEYDVHHISEVVEIIFCPFCGKELKNDNT